MSKITKLTVVTCLSIYLCANCFAAAKWPETKSVSTSPSTSPAGSGAASASIDPAFQIKLDQLMSNSKSWQSFSQVEKLQAVEFIIQFFKVKQNTIILKSAGFYVEQLNQNFAADPNMMSLPLPIAIKVVSVMEYDFYNGQDKDQLAVETLGPQIAEEIKAKRKEFGL